MPQDKDITGYRAHVTISLVPVNKYGDTLSPDSMVNYTMTTKVQGLGGLGRLLEGIDSLLKGEQTGLPL